MSLAPAGRATPIISARGLRVNYGDREVLHGVDFDVMQGETIALWSRKKHAVANARRTGKTLFRRGAGERRRPGERHRP